MKETQRMGMFDDLRCEYPLPGLDDPTTIRFQTKDLECALESYRITKDGRLMRETYRTEDHSDPTKTGLARLAGMLAKVPTGEVDENYHGTLNFYGDKNTGELRCLNLDTGQDDAHPERAEWFEFDAKFTDGKLVEVVRVATVR